MNRQQRRIQERAITKENGRLYSVSECKQMIEMVIKELKSKYDARYSSCLTTTLSAPPLNFGKKRVCEAVKLFFDQIEAIQLGTVTDEQVIEEAKKLGVIITSNDHIFEVVVNPQYKEDKK